MDDRAVNAIDKLNDSVEELTEVIRAANQPLDQTKHVRIVTTPIESNQPNPSNSSGNSSSSGSGSNKESDVNGQLPIVVDAKNTITTRSISVSSVPAPGQGLGPGLGEGEKQGEGTGLVPELRSSIKWEDENQKKHTSRGEGVAAGVAMSGPAGGQGLDNSKDLSGTC